MPRCEQCGKEVDLPFECKFCRSYFCVEHRLPETHNCPNLPPRTPLGSWQTKKEIAIARAKEKTGKFASEGDYHFTREASKKPETKKPFPTKKIVGIILVVTALSALLWYAPVMLSFFKRNQQSTPQPTPPPSHKTETFLLSASYWLTPANVSRNIKLNYGQTLVGNYTITGLPSSDSRYYYTIGVYFLDPQKNIVAWYHEPAKTFSITATLDGVYAIYFTCTTTDMDKLPLVLNVTLAYAING